MLTLPRHTSTNSLILTTNPSYYIVFFVHFSYILYVPFETEDASESGIVYVWIGSKSTPEESKLIQEIAEEMFNNPWVSLQVNFVQ